MGFSGSGIYPFWSLGFGILKKYGRAIQDCIYQSYAGFNVIMNWDSGTCCLKAPRSGIPDGENFTIILFHPFFEKNPGSTPVVLGDRRNIEDACACYTGYKNITMRLGHRNVM